jgi:hypothetical protein
MKSTIDKNEMMKRSGGDESIMRMETHDDRNK